MEIVYLDEEYRLKYDDPIVSAIGFFDGLHLGHMKLVDEVIRIGNKKGYKKALMTFDHQPLYVLGKIKKEYCLTSMYDRRKILQEKGIDYLFVVHFSREVAKMTPHDFIKKYLIDLSICHIVCGFDFHFGDHNLGNHETLKLYDPDHLKVSVIDEVVYDEKKVSSSRIREAIEMGNMELVSILLGRDYKIHGKVIEGRKVGRQLGFPTANIDYSLYLLPARGVYASKVIIDHKEYLGMCNVGYNPTIGTLNKKSVEVHIFDFNEDIYGEDIEIIFLKKTRGETQFHSKEELIKQLTYDKESIKKQF